MAPSRKQQVIDLLKSLETKNPAPFAYANPNKCSSMVRGRTYASRHVWKKIGGAFFLCWSLPH
jgi:hypothetical protein